jgi:hypothetical protein
VVLIVLYSGRILIDAEDVAGHYSDSESSASFYSAKNSESSVMFETSDDDATSEQAYDTEPEILDDDWEPLDDYMFEEELFSTRMFDKT